MDDLAAWLTLILADEKRRAIAQKDWADGWLDPAPRQGPAHGYVGAPVRPKADQILARIEADRQILALHAVVVSDANHVPLGPSCSTCGAWEEYPEDWPCQTVKLLALPHADRPGYQEAWRPA